MTQDGLLVQAPYRGFRVATLGSAATMDLANTRIALDTLAVAAILEDVSGRRTSMMEAS